MLTLHETTRRRICRTAFLLLCIGSLFATILWAIWIDSATRRRIHESTISALLDAPVGIERVSTPRPGVTLYRELTVVDPITRATLARIPSLEIDATATPQSWTALQAELAADAILQIGRLFDRRFVRQSLPESGILFQHTDITLRLHDGRDQTLTNVMGRVSTGKAGPNVSFSFRLAGLQMPHDAVLRVERQREGRNASASRIEFESGDAALPIGLLAAAWPTLGQLGAATFRGKIWLLPTSDGFDAALTGRFDNVDLQLLVSDQFPTTISGLASIELEMMEFRSGRLTLAKGALLAEGGRIWERTLRAAETHLACPLANPQKKLGRSAPYQELAIGFQIDGTRLELTGKCRHEPGALIVADDKPLLLEPQSTQTTIALLRLLSPDNDVQIPAVKATAGLLRVLPLPEAVVDQSTANATRAHSLRPKNRK